MDEAVLRAQKWLNETYEGKKGYTVIPENGITGQTTVRALITALQIELGVATPNGNFGPSTTSLCNQIMPLTKDVNKEPQNIIKILQHGLFCKGYSTVGVTGIFGDNTENAVKKVESDAGFIPTGRVTTLIFKAILNTDPLVLTSGGDEQIRYIQQSLNRKYYEYFGIIPTNGIYERKTNKALIYALQAEEGLSTSSANGNFGPTTKLRCPEVVMGSSLTSYIKIIQYALKCNGISVAEFNGEYDEDLKAKIIEFKNFMVLPEKDGLVDLDTWMALLVSSGNTERSGATGCDCATVITKDNVCVLKDNGITSIGRYLIGLYALSEEEIQVLAKYNIRIFPILQRSGEGKSATSEGYFTEMQADKDAKDAYLAAKKFNFPYGTIIYFAVDFDAYDYQVTETLIPFFSQLYSAFQSVNEMGYKIGIYGPRNVCERICNAGYAESCFVSDMSTGYSGNLGYKMPQKWAFDQFVTKNIYEGKDENSTNFIEVDLDMVRGTYLGELFKEDDDGVPFESVRQRIVNLIGSFEGNEGYKNIAGNADKQGMSLGINQWNFNQNTLQPLLREMIENHEQVVLNIFGESKLQVLKNVLEKTKDEQMAWAESINDSDNRIIEEWKIPFQLLCETEEFIAIQEKDITRQFNQAMERCRLEEFNFKTMRALTLSYNITVNAGGLYQSEFNEMKAQITENMTEKERMLVICDVLQNYRPSAVPRCLCIVNGSGEVNKEIYYVDEDFGITDDIITELIIEGVEE